MEKLTLRNYETFNEIPDGNLLVTENSNLMYIRMGCHVFIAREFIDSVMSDISYTTYVVSYLNVKNNENILTLEVKKSHSNDEVEISNNSGDIDIIPLGKVLNIKGNSETLISLEDIDNLVNFKEEFIPGKKTSVI